MLDSEQQPLIIQGGMGVGVSGWQLARAVSRTGQLGVVSGTAIDSVMVRRLQDGDPGGHVRDAMERFPVQRVSAAVLARFFRPSGRPAGVAYEMLPMYRQHVSAARQELTILAGFVEVWLARQGHDNPVGINLLTKVQMPNLATLYGAMLAGVDYVLMGAGIPREIPGALDALAEHREASLTLEVAGLPTGRAERVTLDPSRLFGDQPQSLRRPRFIAIVSANSLATTLARKATGRVDGFVVEAPTAGGHNAPPRGEPTFNDRGEPVYGERDIVNLQKVAELGLPFWIAGGVGSPEGLRGARALGAAGVQVGTLFAYCQESGLAPDLKSAVLAGVAAGRVAVRTDPRASPTGYPFKIVEMPGVPIQDDTRRRECDLGYLRTPYAKPNGRIGYRCPAEPVDTYVAKGGNAEDTVGRRCLCNGLMADIGLPQVRDGIDEKPLLTSGDDLPRLGRFLEGRMHYSASDVIRYLTHGLN